MNQILRSITQLKNIAALSICFLLTFGAGLIGSIATTPKIDSWYETLERPFFSPPNELFAPVWTLPYALMAISLYLIWIAPRHTSKNNAYVAFGIQLLLNAMWSLVFFGLESPGLAIVVIVAMILAIVLTMKLFRPISKVSSLLLLPYLAWVSFATALTIGIATLN